MKMSHNRTPSDPGPPKAVSHKEGVIATNYDDNEKQFMIWLHAVSVKFMSLTETQRIRTFDSLIGLCGSKEMIHLSDILPNLLYRDFIRLLPIEISTHILMYLDEKSLLNCCLVSKYWNLLINSFREVWIHMARRVGARTVQDPLYPIQMYKQLFIKSTYLIQCIKNKTAFDVMTLEGHRGRVMAIKYHGDVVATGSDDHTVRFWDIYTGECVKIVHTHSVSALQFDDLCLYTASYDNTAACWDIDTGQLVCRYVGHISAVFSLDARRDLDLIVTGSADKTVKIWQLSSGLLLNSLTDWHNDWITRIQIVGYIASNDEPGQGTLQLVTVDRQGCCFWTVTNNEKVEVSVTHSADWCMNVPFVTQNNSVSVCTWNKRDRTQYISTYTTETVDKKCVPCHVSSVVLPKELPTKQTILGLGTKFAIFMVDEGYSRVVIVDVHSCRVICSIPIPPYRPTQNGASATLGSFDWLDGFTESNRHGLFLAVCQKDNNILLFKWKEV